MQSDIQTSTKTLSTVNAKTDPVILVGDFLVLVKGTFVGSLALQRRIFGSADEADFLPVMLDTAGTPAALTKPGVYAFSDPSLKGGEYRLSATTLTSGSAIVSFDQ